MSNEVNYRREANLRESRDNDILLPADLQSWYHAVACRQEARRQAGRGVGKGGAHLREPHELALEGALKQNKNLQCCSYEPINSVTRLPALQGLRGFSENLPFKYSFEYP